MTLDGTERVIEGYNIRFLFANATGNEYSFHLSPSEPSALPKAVVEAKPERLNCLPPGGHKRNQISAFPDRRHARSANSGSRRPERSPASPAAGWLYTSFRKTTNP
jgi:hypothetical protein